MNNFCKCSNVMMMAFVAVSLMFSACKDKDEPEEVVVTLTGVSPETVSPGADVTLTGTNLDHVKAVRFSKDAQTADVVKANFVSVSATQIVVTLPANAPVSKVAVLDEANKSIVWSGTLTEYVEPIVVTLTGVAPATIATGADLTLTGTNLDHVNAVRFTDLNVNVDVLKVNFVSVSATQIVVTVPADAPFDKVAVVSEENEVILWSGTLTEDVQDIERANWEIVDFDNEWASPGYAAVENLLDNWPAPGVDPNLVWQTVTHDPTKNFPYYVVIDFHKNLKVSGIIWHSMPEALGITNIPKNVKFEVADEQSGPWTTILELEVPNLFGMQELPCDVVMSARYLKFTIFDGWTGENYTGLRSISIY